MGFWRRLQPGMPRFEVGTCAEFVADAGFSVCHCSLSSVQAWATPAGDTPLTEQWHTVASIVTILPNTLNVGRVLANVAGIGSECPERGAQKKGVLPKVVPGGKHLQSANTPWISELNRSS